MTGAAGTIGTAVSPVLAGRWDLHRTDQKSDVDSLLDVTDEDACRAAFAGADAVVHLAANPDPEAVWDDLSEPNVTGTYRVARAAMDCGVRRLVLASSIHAVSSYPSGRQTRAEDPPRPANLYGATKAWAEALGAWVAAASPTSVVALRIGYFAVQRPDEDFDLLGRRAWLSGRDAAELVRAAVEADVSGFVVAVGTSANRHPQADLTRTCERLGYQPVDDAF